MYFDIEKDTNMERRQKLLSRVARYKTLNNPKTFTSDYFNNQGWRCSNSNDIIDNNLLACVKDNVVDYLITEDRVVHKKAKKSLIGLRVFTIEQFLDLIRKTKEDKLCCVEDVPCSELSVGIKFFDSLRDDYEEFDKWFEDKCISSGRRCWIIRDCLNLCALCIYKFEREGVIGESGFNPGCKMLKLCTFKVDDDSYGSKMGENICIRKTKERKYVKLFRNICWEQFN